MPFFICHFSFAMALRMNFKLTIQYDGTDFHGWQMQSNQRTVQGELTRVLSLIEGREVVVQGSGRTDAGVHAEGQVANVRLERVITPEKLRAAVNGNLEPDVRVFDVQGEDDGFHARFSARGKTYVYRVVKAPVMSPFWARFAHQEARELDLERMRSGAQLLLGEHDWTAFSSAQSDAETRVRTIKDLEIAERWEERGRCNLLEMTVTANGFLRYMARSIAGTLLALARNDLDEETISRALLSGERSLAGPTAPACGLTLLRVQYD